MVTPELAAAVRAMHTAAAIVCAGIPLPPDTPPDGYLAGDLGCSRLRARDVYALRDALDRLALAWGRADLTDSR